MPFGGLAKAIGSGFKSATNFGSEFFGQLGRGFGSIPGLQGVQSILANRGGLLGNLAINYLTDAFGVGAEYQGGRLGSAQRAFMDAAYPGTNPWERLGTGQGGAAGAVAKEGQNLQDRLNRRTLSAQKEIAEKNALATVAAPMIKEFPSMGAHILGAISEKVPTTPEAAKSAMSERRLQLDDRIRTGELAVKKEAVRIEDFKSATGRLMFQLESGRFDLETARKQFEAATKNKEVAIATVNALRQAYDSMGSNAWKAFRSTWEETGKEPSNLFQQLRRHVQGLKAQPTQTPGMLRMPMSAPGAGERRVQ